MRFRWALVTGPDHVLCAFRDRSSLVKVDLETQTRRRVLKRDLSRIEIMLAQLQDEHRDLMGVAHALIKALQEFDRRMIRGEVAYPQHREFAR